jgi:hypothetical protein
LTIIENLARSGGLVENDPSAGWGERGLSLDSDGPKWLASFRKRIDQHHRPAQAACCARMRARPRVAGLRETDVVDGAVSAELLRYNPNNATTVVVERVRTADGSRVRKVLRRLAAAAGDASGHGST